MATTGYQIFIEWIARVHDGQNLSFRVNKIQKLLRNPK